MKYYNVHYKTESCDDYYYSFKSERELTEEDFIRYFVNEIEKGVWGETEEEAMEEIDGLSCVENVEEVTSPDFIEIK